MRSLSKSPRCSSCDLDHSESANTPDTFSITSPFDQPFRLERTVAQFCSCHAGEGGDCCRGVGACEGEVIQAVGDDPVRVIERVDVSLQLIDGLPGTVGASEMERGIGFKRGDYVVGSAFLGSSHQFPGCIGCALRRCFEEESCQQHDSCNCTCRDCCEKHAPVVALHRYEQEGRAEKCQPDSCRPGILQDVSSEQGSLRYSRIRHVSSIAKKAWRVNEQSVRLTPPHSPVKCSDTEAGYALGWQGVP